MLVHLGAEVVVTAGSGCASRAGFPLQVHGLALAVPGLTVVAHNQLLPFGASLEHGVATTDLIRRIILKT